MDGVMERVAAGENPPLCTECGGVLKPNAVFFGEMLPRIPWERSLDLTRQTDLFAVLGSSLQVSPVNILPAVALRAGAKLIIVNLMPTPYDADATLIVRDKVGVFASIVLELLRSEAAYD
jgi:NAD-dependent deacetylase